MADPTSGDLAGGNLAILTMLTDHGNSIREFSRTMDTGFADIRARLESKADKGDVAELKARIYQLESARDKTYTEISKRIDEIQTAIHREEGRTHTLQEHETRKLTRRQSMWAAIGVAFLVCATLASAFISSAHIF